MPAPAEPRPQARIGPFEAWDFEAVGPSHSTSPELNERRLATRRRLLSLGKELAKRAADAGLELETRSSLHNPHAFNHQRVSRLWAYVCRGKREKTRLRKVVGRDLARDLDSAYRNAYLCLALEHDALEVSLRLHADAWFDGQNLVNRTRKEGTEAWLERLNQLSGFRLRLHDWKGEWPCGALTRERVEEFLRFYTPGEHSLAVERRWPIPTDPAGREVGLGEAVPLEMLAEAERLLPMYRFVAWSEESDFLFSR